ncbi:hypothetical protein [Providencia sp. PROV019]|nr:hypothetical protein [Providencia sp. PROV019]
MEISLPTVGLFAILSIAILPAIFSFFEKFSQAALMMVYTF